MIIERLGQGSFSHWDRDLFFSTSDNTDPRVSDRTYLVKSWVSTSTDLLGTIRKLEAEKRASAEALARLSEEIPQMKAEKRASAEALARLSEEIQQMKASKFWRLRLRLQRYPRTYRALARTIRALSAS